MLGSSNLPLFCSLAFVGHRHSVTSISGTYASLCPVPPWQGSPCTYSRHYRVEKATGAGILHPLCKVAAGSTGTRQEACSRQDSISQYNPIGIFYHKTKHSYRLREQPNRLNELQLRKLCRTYKHDCAGP